MNLWERAKRDAKDLLAVLNRQPRDHDEADLLAGDVYAAMKNLADTLAEMERVECVEGWAEGTATNCSCANAETWEFDRDCGHKTANRPALLLLLKEDR